MKKKSIMTLRTFQVFLACTVVLAIFMSASLLLGSIYGGGWEINTTIYSVGVNEETYTSTSLPPIVDEWGAKRVHLDTSEFVYGGIGGTVALVPDFSGTPDIIVTVSNPYHVTYTGTEWARDTTDTPFRTITKSYDTDGDGKNDKIIKWHHHVYMYDLDVSTDADIYEAGGLSYIEARPNGLNDAGKGTVARVNVRILFDLSKWRVSTTSVQDGEDKYVFQSGWAGIMSSTMYKSEPYFVSGQAPDAYTISSYPQTGAPLNMYLLSGQPQPSMFKEDYNQILDVPDKVLIETYCELLGGYDWPLFGSITPLDVGVHFKIRVDVLTSEGFVLESGQQPTMTTQTQQEQGSDPVGVFFSALAAPFIAFTDWLAQNQSAVFSALIMVIVVIIVVLFVLTTVRTTLIRKILR